MKIDLSPFSILGCNLDLPNQVKHSAPGFQGPNISMTHFPPIIAAYNVVFRPNRLSLGLVVPLEGHSTGPVPTMTRHLDRVRLTEDLGFAALRLRDVLFNLRSFGDARLRRWLLLSAKSA